MSEFSLAFQIIDNASLTVAAEARAPLGINACVRLNFLLLFQCFAVCLLYITESVHFFLAIERTFYFDAEIERVRERKM